MVLAWAVVAAVTMTGCGVLSGLDNLDMTGCTRSCDGALPEDAPSSSDDDVKTSDAGGADTNDDVVDGAMEPSRDADDWGDTHDESDGAHDASGDVMADGAADGRSSDAGEGDASLDAPPDAPTIDASDGGGTMDGSVSDGGRLDGSDSGDAGAKCPGTAGPSPVRVGSFCIDSTEVTNDHYAAFLASNPSTASLPAVCAYKTGFTPTSAWPPAPSKGSFPVVYVDWCSAKAYCAWAGKRLCGAIGGGSVPISDAADKDVDQWYVACSANGTRAYPYGNNFSAGRCNESESGVGSAEPVASRNACVGGSPGIYDINGNVWEWEDGCDGETGERDGCLARGGSYAFSGAMHGACATRLGDQRSRTFPDTGIRCCSP